MAIDLTCDVSSKRITPGVINLKEFENGTTSMIWTVSSRYTTGLVDLNDFDAYLNLSVRGHIDQIKLTKVLNADDSISLTWDVGTLSTFLVGYAKYQIVFKAMGSGSLFVTCPTDANANGTYTVQNPEAIQSLRTYINDHNYRIFIGAGGKWTLENTSAMTVAYKLIESVLPSGDNWNNCTVADTTATVFNTYEALMYVSESIASDTSMMAQFPTMLRQWELLLSDKIMSSGLNAVRYEVTEAMFTANSGPGSTYFLKLEDIDTTGKPGLIIGAEAFQLEEYGYYTQIANCNFSDNWAGSAGITVPEAFNGYVVVYYSEGGGRWVDTSERIAEVIEHDYSLSGNGTFADKLKVSDEYTLLHSDKSDNQNVWYLDPVNGLDTNSGLSRSAPKKTGDAVVIACKAAGKSTGRLVVMAGTGAVTFTAANWADATFPFFDVVFETAYTECIWDEVGFYSIFKVVGGVHTFNSCRSGGYIIVKAKESKVNGGTWSGLINFDLESYMTVDGMTSNGDLCIQAPRLEIPTTFMIKGTAKIQVGALCGAGSVQSYSNFEVYLDVQTNRLNLEGNFSFPSQIGNSSIKITAAKMMRTATTKLLYLGADTGVTVNYQLVVDTMGSIVPLEIANTAGTVAGKVIELLKYENKVDAEIIRATAAEALKADLVGGKVPTDQLPSYIDDVVDAYVVGSTPYASDWLSLTVGGAALTPESGKIYIVLTAGIYEMLEFRWSGSVYAEISKSLALGETSSTAGRGDHTKAAYDHTLLTSGNPHGVTKTDVGLGNVDNVADADKPVSTAQAEAIAAHADLLTGMHGLPALDHFVYGDTIYGGTIVDNLNTLARTMPFTCHGTSAGAPDTTHSWFGWHLNSNAGNVSASQMAVAFGTDLIVKYRTKTASVWGPWKNGSTIVNDSTSTAYTFLASDANTCHIVNTSEATTRTVPSDTTAPDIAIGDFIEVQNIGTGVVTFVADSGVTIRSSLTLVMYGQYSVCMLRKIAANTWVLTGERTAV